MRTAVFVSKHAGLQYGTLCDRSLYLYQTQPPRLLSCMSVLLWSLLQHLCVFLFCAAASSLWERRWLCIICRLSLSSYSYTLPSQLLVTALVHAYTFKCDACKPEQKVKVQWRTQQTMHDHMHKSHKTGLPCWLVADGR